MGAETLRRAAALMRERAEAATPGQWLVDADAADFPVLAPDTSDFTWDGVFICTTRLDEKADANRADADHIASWHPAVALAVADWLDGVAWAIDSDDELAEPGFGEPTAAFAVARAYLGESA